jgi:hypothetical protein
MDRFFTWANLHKGPFTSFLGVVIILASLVSVFSHGRSWTEAAAGIGVGMVLLGLKDPSSPAGATGVVGGAVLISMLAFGGCASQKRVLAKYGTQNPPVTIAVTDAVPVAVKTKPDSLKAALALDSLVNSLLGDTIHFLSAGGQAQVSMWKTAANTPGGSQHLQVRVKVPPQVVHDTVRVTLYGKCPPTYTLAPKAKPGRLQRYWQGYSHFCTALVSIVLVVSLLLLGYRLGLFSFLKFLPFLGVLVLASSSSLASCRAQPMPYRFAPRQPSYLPMPLPRPVHRPRIHY